jgi:hypothetical protein
LHHLEVLTSLPTVTAVATATTAHLNTLLCALQDVYELSWQVDELARTITFNATFTGMQPSGYFAVGISASPVGRMMGADIAFVAFQVRFFAYYVNYLFLLMITMACWSQVLRGLL